jgi:hypothetical protein
VKGPVKGSSTAECACLHCLFEARGTLENAQAMAAHESPRRTKLYDRTADVITLHEVERIVIELMRLIKFEEREVLTFEIGLKTAC